MLALCLMLSTTYYAGIIGLGLTSARNGVCGMQEKPANIISVKGKNAGKRALQRVFTRVHTFLQCTTMYIYMYVLP